MEGNSNSVIGGAVRLIGSDYTPSKWVPGWDQDVYDSTEIDTDGCTK